jgi:hypothetical protein
LIVRTGLCTATEPAVFNPDRLNDLLTMVNQWAPGARTALGAVGRVLKAGKRPDVVEMSLHDGEQNLVGHATGTFLVLPGVELP